MSNHTATEVVLFACIGICLAPASRVEAQTVLAGEPMCTECLRFEHVASLGSETDSSSVTYESTLATDSDGNFYVAPLAHAGEVYVYDRHGSYVRSLGRLGQGPGEYGGSLMLAMAGDSLVVVDNSNRRRTVLAPDLNYARDHNLPGQVRDFILLESGDLVIESTLGTQSSFGMPLHRLSASDGRVVRSYGAPSDGILRRFGMSRMRSIASAGGDAVWSAQATRYRIDRFDGAGVLESTIIRPVDWFEPWEREPPGAYQLQPPAPRIAGLSATPSYLVVFLLVPDAQWSRPDPDEPTAWDARRLAHHFDTLVEVLDPARGRVVASRRFDTWVRPTTSGDLAYSTTQDAVGNTQLKVWRFSIDERSEPGS